MKRTFLFPTFIICFIFALAIYFLMRNSSFDLPHLLISPLQKKIFIMRKGNPSVPDKLNQENDQLRSKLDLVLKENQALKDQFSADQNLVHQDNSHLLPASIVSMPDFIPGLNKPSFCIINMGSKEHIYVGQPVIINNILIGIVTKTTDNFSIVQFIFSPKMSFSVKTLHTNAIGILMGGNMTLENVVLSDSLTVGDTVTTIGNADINGKGVPADLIIGRISSVEKNSSSLFQKAYIKPLADVTKLSTVFLITR